MVSALTANVITTCLECTLYGIFLVLTASILPLWIRCRDSEGPRGQWCALTGIWSLRRSPLVLANLFFLLTITAHWAVGIHRLLLGVVKHEDMHKSTSFFTDLHETTQVVRSVLLFLDIFVGDLVMTYRTWVVWGRQRRVIVFPVIIIIGLLATSSALVYEFIAATPEQSVYTNRFRHWVIGFCSATLVTNAYATGMITYRIWKSTRLWKKHGLLAARGKSSSRIVGAMEIFVESAALYSVWFALFLALYVVRSPLQAAGSGCSPAMAGISFMLISVGASLGLCGSDDDGDRSFKLGSLILGPGLPSTATVGSPRGCGNANTRPTEEMQVIHIGVDGLSSQEVILSDAHAVTAEQEADRDTGPCFVEESLVWVRLSRNVTPHP